MHPYDAPPASGRLRVCADTSFLVHVFQAGETELLLQRCEVFVTEHVASEIKVGWEKTLFDAAVAAGDVQVVVLDRGEDITLFVELGRRMGQGEAAAIVAAKRFGLLLATDDVQAPVRKAIAQHLGGSLMTFADFMREAIEAGVRTVDEADTVKRRLHVEHGYVMPFTSFAHVVRRPLRE